jgi:hypothetical protein
MGRTLKTVTLSEAIRKYLITAQIPLDIKLAAEAVLASNNSAAINALQKEIEEIEKA